MSKKTIDLGVVEAPTPEKLDEPWIFRAACHLKKPEVTAGVLVFGVILDLGFGIYRQINTMLEGVLVRDDMADLAVAFADNWAANGQPNPLEVCTLGSHGELWGVHVYRIELAIETLDVLGRVSLADALLEQGLVERVEDAEVDA